MSGADDSVIEQLEARRARVRRQPPPRRPPRGVPAAPSLATPDEPGASDEESVPGRVVPKPARSRPAAAPKPVPSSQAVSRPPTERAPVPSQTDTWPLGLAPDEPIASYAVRVRRSLDDLVAWRLAELRRHGVRTSKVEITEMLLWELTSATSAELDQRLATFREHAPR